MASLRGNWREDNPDKIIQFDQSEDLAAYIENNLKEADKYDRLYKRGDQEILIQVDRRDPAFVRCYVYDLDRRGANYLQEALLSVSNEVIDVGSEIRNKTMFEPNTKPRLLPEEAIQAIENYKVAQALKQDVQPVMAQKTTSGWLTHTLFGGRKSETPPAPEAVKTSGKIETPEGPRKK